MLHQHSCLLNLYRGIMDDISHSIKEARPRLSKVSPLAAKIVLGFGIVNILLGLGLASTQARLATSLVIAPNQFAYQAWGAAFTFLGILMLLGYYHNEWKFMRQTFIIGMAFKFAWAIALVVRYTSGQQSNPLLLIIWLFFAYIQAVTYIHFLPIPTVARGGEDERR